MGATSLESIREALSVLEPSQDEQWTADGLPRMDVIETLVGDKEITRKDVTDADPEFCREEAQKRLDDAQRALEEAAAEADSEENPDGLQETEKAETQTAPVDPAKDKGEIVQDELQEVSEQIEELLGHQAEIQQAIDQLQRKQAKLQRTKQAMSTPEEDMKARMAFIQSQGAQRAKRFEKGRQILRVIGKEGLTPMSQLDQAMSRKTARGAQRPQPRTPGQE